MRWYVVTALLIVAVAATFLTTAAMMGERDANPSHLEQRVGNACEQTAAMLVQLAARMDAGSATADDLSNALVYGQPAIWLCTGGWSSMEPSSSNAEHIAHAIRERHL